MSSTHATALEPFVVAIPDDILRDLATRLKATRWSTDLDNEDQFYGVSTSYMKELVDYWIAEFDWRAAERDINAFSHYRVNIDGVPIHFIRHLRQRAQAHSHHSLARMALDILGLE
jgi:hypothetical protein